MAEEVTLRNIILETNAEVRPLIESWLRSLEAKGESDRLVGRDYCRARSARSRRGPRTPDSQSIRRCRASTSFAATSPYNCRSTGPMVAAVSRESVGAAVRMLCSSGSSGWSTEGELEVSPMARLRAPAIL